MQNRKIAFRAWDKKNGGVMREVRELNIRAEFLTDEEGRALDVPQEAILMQFTGMLDKNEVAEVYEGDIIDAEGVIVGNIYESPQIQQERTNHVIAGMGTNAWGNTESIAMGRGCKYAQ